MALEYLNAIEKDAIQQFLANETMVRAVEKVVLSGIYFNGTLRPGETADPTRNFALALVSEAISKGIPDETIGQDIRGRTIGIGLVKDAFDKLKEMKKVVSPVRPKDNPGR